MAKTAKIDKKQSKAKVKKIRFQMDKKKSNSILKECVVKLNKMDDSFLKRWLEPLEPAASFTFDVKIKNDRLKINQTEIRSVSPSVFNICLQIRRGAISIKPSIELDQFVEGDASPVKNKSNKNIAKTLNQLMNENWVQTKREKKLSKVILEENDIVMAKMKGYSPWPGKIISFTKTRKSAQVYFYGSHNKGSVEEAEIALFEDSHKVIRLQLLRPLLIDFCKGIREVEIEMQIPAELSIMNEPSALK